MATAICDNNHLTHWRARRGTRLTDVRCSEPGCAAKLHAATYQSEGWKRREAKTNGQQGRHKANCAICGRSSFCEKRQLDTVTHLFFGVGYAYRMPVIIKADDPICWRHSVFPNKSWFWSDSASLFEWFR